MYNLLTFSSLYIFARSAVTTPLAMLTSLHDVPQVSYWSTSTKLDDSGSYPTFLRTIPSDTSTATSIAELVAGAPFYARRLSMIYVKDAYGMSYMEALYDACVARNVSLDAYPFTFGDLSSIANSVKALKNSDARYVSEYMFSVYVYILSQYMTD
jgi:phosphatidylinositol phospholipase C delta